VRPLQADIQPDPESGDPPGRRPQRAGGARGFSGPRQAGLQNQETGGERIPTII
jgi:hypothetical protein